MLKWVLSIDIIFSKMKYHPAKTTKKKEKTGAGVVKSMLALTNCYATRLLSSPSPVVDASTSPSSDDGYGS